MPCAYFIYYRRFSKIRQPFAREKEFFCVAIFSHKKSAVYTRFSVDFTIFSAARARRKRKAKAAFKTLYFQVK